MSIENVKLATAKIREGMRILDNGPLDFYLEEMSAAYDLLMSRFSPFKVGDRVRICKEIDFSNAPGWEGCRHFLIIGALGTVHAASCGSRGFLFDIYFDDESWINNIGENRNKPVIVPMSPDRKHTFCLGERCLELAKTSATDAEGK